MATIQDVIEQYNDLPSGCAILGTLGDGVPVMFDLYDSRTKSVLYVGQEGGNDAIRDVLKGGLRSIFESAVALNTPYEVRAVILTRDPADWEDITRQYDNRYTIEIVNSGSRRAGDLIMEMSTKAEQRTYGRELGPAILVIIDNLKDIYQQDYEATLSFEYMLREGARSQVWPIAVVRGDEVEQLPLWVSAFRVHINQNGPQFEVRLNGQMESFRPLE